MLGLPQAFTYMLAPPFFLFPKLFHFRIYPSRRVNATKRDLIFSVLTIHFYSLIS